ncbi:hypothetical protein LCGC14_0846090 [marine sediment metagenome]|uniref:Uncharacterized protein n=1 Tax=marine sediment metagenome TaxID=412755 RepID=A0A0F9PGG4_9ZZZZ
MKIKCTKIPNSSFLIAVNWIVNCSDVKFAEYMVEIALVMDLVFKVVIMKR